MVDDALDLGVRHAALNFNFGQLLAPNAGDDEPGLVWNGAMHGPVQIAGGGRYDTMMEMLGAKKPVSAIGCAIRTERVLAAKRGGK